MTYIAITGAGVSNVTTAYTLSQLGYQVMALDRHLYPVMETPSANDGQFSASNAEIWNNTGTLFKDIRWMLRNDTPPLLNPKPSWHKYSWIGELVTSITHYRRNTIETTHMAIETRKHLLTVAEREQIDFDLQKRGILHVYHDKVSLAATDKVNALFVADGLEQRIVNPEEIAATEPTLRGDYCGGYLTAFDTTGDTHKFMHGLAQVRERRGARFMHNVDVCGVETTENGARLLLQITLNNHLPTTATNVVQDLAADAMVVCAGVGSRHTAQLVGDRTNVYPVENYSITVHLDGDANVQDASWVSLPDESAEIVTNRLGAGRFCVVGTAEFNGYNRDICADRIEPLMTWTCHSFMIDTSRMVPQAGLRSMMPGAMPRVGRGRHARVSYSTGHGHLGWMLPGVTAAMVGDAVA